MLKSKITYQHNLAMHVCIYTYIYVCIYVCIYVYIYIYIYIYILLNRHFSNYKFHVYSQSSICTNMNQIDNTDFFLANYLANYANKRLMNIISYKGPNRQ